MEKLKNILFTGKSRFFIAFLTVFVLTFSNIALYATIQKDILNNYEQLVISEGEENLKVEDFSKLKKVEYNDFVLEYIEEVGSANGLYMTEEQVQVKLDEDIKTYAYSDFNVKTLNDVYFNILMPSVLSNMNVRVYFLIFVDAFLDYALCVSIIMIVAYVFNLFRYKRGKILDFTSLTLNLNFTLANVTVFFITLIYVYLRMFVDYKVALIAVGALGTYIYIKLYNKVIKTTS